MRLSDVFIAVSIGNILGASWIFFVDNNYANFIAGQLVVITGIILFRIGAWLCRP